MIHIEPEIVKQLSEHALQTFPYECSGFVLGFETTKNRFITKSLPVENVSESDKRRHFKISASDYLKAERYAQENGLTLLGIYHSHPKHPSVPSESDRRAAQPYFSYLILSVSEKQVKNIQSWILNDQQQFDEERIFQNKELNNFKIKDLWLQL